MKWLSRLARVPRGRWLHFCRASKIAFVAATRPLRKRGGEDLRVPLVFQCIGQELSQQGVVATSCGRDQMEEGYTAASLCIVNMADRCVGTTYIRPRSGVSFLDSSGHCGNTVLEGFQAAHTTYIYRPHHYAVKSPHRPSKARVIRSTRKYNLIVTARTMPA